MMKFIQENPKITWIILVVLFCLPFLLLGSGGNALGDFVLLYWFILLIITGLYVWVLTSDKSKLANPHKFSLTNVFVGVGYAVTAVVIGLLVMLIFLFSA